MDPTVIDAGLQEAIQVDNLELVKFFISVGADPNMRYGVLGDTVTGNHIRGLRMKNERLKSEKALAYLTNLNHKNNSF